MKTIVYSCDECGEVLSSSIKWKELPVGVAIQHLSIHFDEDEYSGWVEPNKDGKWKHQTVVGGIKHFCNGKCLGNYFNKLKQKQINKSKI